MLTLVFLEFKKLKRSRIIYISIATIFLFFLCAAAQGIKSRYSPERLINETLFYSTFFILPALIALIGSYMIGREYQDDTIKSILIIPVEFTRMAIIKMFTALLIGVGMSLLLCVFTVITSGIIDPKGITAAFILEALRKYILQAIACFMAVVPIIAITTMLKNGHLISVVLTEMYSFMGLFAASSNYRNIYPISAAYSFSGAAIEVTLKGYLLCIFSLMASVIIGMTIFKVKKSGEEI